MLRILSDGRKRPIQATRILRVCFLDFSVGIRPLIVDVRHMPIPFDNSYARLPERFYVRQQPAQVPAPQLIRINDALAASLQIDPEWLASSEGVAMLSGNAVVEGSEPLAQAYAGHQFGGWVPQLGDGRALLLGEVVDREGVRRDIQLKGSGQTPFSRAGDGKSALGPVLRGCGPSWTADR